MDVFAKATDYFCVCCVRSIELCAHEQRILQARIFLSRFISGSLQEQTQRGHTSFIVGHRCETLLKQPIEAHGAM